MSKSNRISLQTNGRYDQRQSRQKARYSGDDNPLRKFVIQRPATALLSGFALGAVITWMVIRRK